MTHFNAVLLFALFVSIVFGVTMRDKPKMMIRFGAYCFGMLVGAVIVASWVMKLIKP